MPNVSGFPSLTFNLEARALELRVFSSWPGVRKNYSIPTSFNFSELEDMVQVRILEVVRIGGTSSGSSPSIDQHPGSTLPEVGQCRVLHSMAKAMCSGL